MGNRTIHFCDRCGAFDLTKVIEVSVSGLELKIGRMERIGQRSIDLCSDCGQALAQFLGSRKESTDG